MKRLCLSLAALAALCSPVAAQDSTAPQTIFNIGDAVDQFATGEQLNRYVLDLSPISSSCGYDYRIGPLSKASKGTFQLSFLNALISHSSISTPQRLDLPFAYGSYDVWENAPGFGISYESNRNLTPNSVSTTGRTGNQFAYGFAEFSTSLPNNINVNNIIGGIVNFDPNDPNRLYVSRVVAAINGDNDVQNFAQMGYGSVDAHGNIYFRCDDFGVPVSLRRILGNNMFRVHMLDPDGGGAQTGRNPASLNVIDLSSNDDPTATDWLLQFDTVTHACPGNIAQQVNGARPVLLSANFEIEYVREQVANALTSDMSHISTSDHRGALFFSSRLACEPNSVGTVGLIGRGPSFSRQLNIFSVNANGVVQTKFALSAPQTWNNLPPNNRTFGGAANNGATFEHYRSQTAFRGGPQCAVGADAAGRGLAAAVMYDRSAFNNDIINPYNLIAVARWSCGGQANATWSHAAYVARVSAGANPTDPKDDQWDGSVYCDATGAPAGTLAPYYSLNLDPNTSTNTTGPSMSGPAIDAAGNVWFTAVYRPFGSNFSNSGVFRAIYNPTTFSYSLDLVLPWGAIVAGENSGVSYRISDLEIVDGDSVGSGTNWAGNVMQMTWDGSPVADFAPADPLTLGGLVVSAAITYDSDGDGDYGLPAGLNADQRYSALLVIRPDVPTGPAPCPGDMNCDGVRNFSDIDPFVLALQGQAAYEAQFPNCNWLNGDLNNDGTVNFGDIDLFVAALGAGQCP